QPVVAALDLDGAGEVVAPRFEEVAQLDELGEAVEVQIPVVLRDEPGERLGVGRLASYHRVPGVLGDVDAGDGRHVHGALAGVAALAEHALELQRLGDGGGAGGGFV